MEIYWCQMGDYGGCGSTSQPRVLNDFLSYFGDMRSGVVVQQKNSMLPIRSFLLNRRLELFHLLNIEFGVDRLVSFNNNNNNG